MIEKILSELSFEEKAKLLTGTSNSDTYSVERLDIKPKNMVDASHGVRLRDPDSNCTHFPNSCSFAATWDRDLCKKLGEALSKECIYNKVDMLLGPGINIIKNPLCGRNFEYLSEDPVLAGELAAAYINGLQSRGIAASLKHFAANNQEVDRCEASVDVDERTLREIYLKAFEIVVKKANPASIMCAYNKLDGIWCSENKFLLNDILKEEWGYEGLVVSDWGAVHNCAKAIAAGLDLQMPLNKNITEDLKNALDNKTITMERIDDAVRRVLKFLLTKIDRDIEYDRDEQHQLAREIGAAGVVLLKNEDNVLPLTSEKYKKIAIIGEYADKPLISGQGSVEVKQKPEYVDSAVEELRKLLPNVEIVYKEFFKKGEFPKVMQWSRKMEIKEFVEDADIVLLFMGDMEGENTEKFDKTHIEMNPQFRLYTDEMLVGKKVISVLQNGSATIPYAVDKGSRGIVEMWLGGEAAGGAIADVLCGVVNPSGKLPQTFPKKLRTDLDYPGDSLKMMYNERFEVGYRYYDKHPDEIAYPFGYGLSYTSFEYSDLKLNLIDGKIDIQFKLKNTGNVDGAEIVEIYVNDPVTTVPKPEKELKTFDKIFLKAGEEKTVKLTVDVKDLAYYNYMLHSWIVEDGLYNILVASSSVDIRLSGSVNIDGYSPYSMLRVGVDMMG